MASPTWSPDGRRLAFVGRSLCCNWLYSVRPRRGRPSAGSSPRRCAGPPGRRQARSRSSTTTTEAASLSASRTAPTRSDPTARGCGGCLAATGERATSPTGRLMGSTIAFVARRHIFSMRADGRRLRRLTDNYGDSEPAWSPDGRHIAFIRDYDLYIMRANGRGQRRVVDGPDQGLGHPGPWAEVRAPTWQPLPPLRSPGRGAARRPPRQMEGSRMAGPLPVAWSCPPGAAGVSAAAALRGPRRRLE